LVLAFAHFSLAPPKTVRENPSQFSRSGTLVPANLIVPRGMSGASGIIPARARTPKRDALGKNGFPQIMHICGNMVLLGFFHDDDNCDANRT
jgi:hypothetical protein